MPEVNVNRRRFLRQSFAFSAAAALNLPGMIASAMPVPGGEADLLMIGDWGWDANGHPENAAGQRGVAQAMQRYVADNPLRTDALLFLGDNWYGALDGGVNSPRWQAQFEDLYPAGIFNVPAYAILGNHDYQKWPESKVEAELAYASTGKSRWTMPSRWYRFEFPRKNPLITFLAVDTNLPSIDGHPAKAPSFSMEPELVTEQLAWLETELRRPKATPFLAVMGHHPLYSDGPHGDHRLLIESWDPLFRKYKVDFYLAGHDHDLQHLEFEGHPTSFFLSGGGGADLYNLKIEPQQRGPYAQKVYGFSHLSVTKKEVTLRHLDSSGRVLHAFTRTPSGKITILNS